MIVNLITNDAQRIDEVIKPLQLVNVDNYF